MDNLKTPNENIYEDKDRTTENEMNYNDNFEHEENRGKFTTRFKKFLNKIINAPRLSFVVFALINIILITAQNRNVNYNSALEYDNMHISNFNRIIHSIKVTYMQFEELLFANYIKNIEMILMHRIVNIVCLVVLCYILVLFFKYLYRCLSRMLNKNYKYKNMVFKCLLGIYFIITLLTLFSVDNILNVYYLVGDFVGNIINNIFFNATIAESPTQFFGINMLIRWFIALGSIFTITKLSAIIKYIFFDRVERDSSGKIVAVNPNSGRGISRFIRFFYNEDENKLNLSNIIALGSVITVYITIAVDIKLHGSELATIKYLGSLLEEILQISNITNTPFESPLPVSVVINFVFRIISCGIYFSTFITIYFLIKTSWDILNAKGAVNNDHVNTYRILFIMSIANMVLVLWIYLIGGNASDIQVSGFAIFKTIIFANIILAILELSIIVILKYSRNIYNTIKKIVNNKLSSDNGGKDIKENALKLWSLLIILYYKTIRAAKALLNPIFDGFYSIEDEDSVHCKILLAAGNFCAIASQITTLLGLVIFFKNDIISWNILKSILTLVICFCLTTGVQYILFATGTNIGKKIRNAFVNLFYTVFKKPRIKHGKAFLANFLPIPFLIALYILPMTISSVFSFSSFFGGVSMVAGFRDTVNMNVWNASEKIGKERLAEIVNCYNESNNILSSAIDTAFNMHLDIYNAISAWDALNVSVTGSNQEYAAIVDSFVFEYNDKVNGIENYKNTLELILLDDINTNYQVAIQEQSVYFGSKVLYNKKGHVIIYLPNDSNNNNDVNMPTSTPNLQTNIDLGNIIGNNHNIQINPLWESNNANVINDGEIRYGTIEISCYDVTKYQLIDILFHEYLNKLNLTNAAYTAAMTMVNNNNKYSNINGNYGKIEINELSKKYYDSTIYTKNIFDSFVRIRDDISRDANEEISVDDLQSISQLPAAIEKYVHYNKEDSNKTFDQSIERLTKTLSYLPEVTKITNVSTPTPTTDPNNKYDEEDTVAASNVSTPTPTTDPNNKYDEEDTVAASNVSTPTPTTDPNNEYDEEDTVAASIAKINNYYNYADSRSSSLVFGLDVLYNGDKNEHYLQKAADWIFNIKEDKDMNIYEEEGINQVYTHASITAFLMILAYSIDFLPIVIGIFVGKNRVYRIKRKKKKSRNKIS